MSAVSGDEYQVGDFFDGLGLREGLLCGIRSYGWERPSYPSKIQQRAIKAILRGCDTVDQTQSGMGKMATCLIGALQRIDYGTRECQSLILTPTRELAQQTHQAARKLGANLGLRCHSCVGCYDGCGQVDRLQDGQHLVVGTPYFVMRMVSKGHLRVTHLACLVLDDPEEMFSRGFKDSVYEIFENLPRDVQVCLFSATLPNKVLDLTKNIMRDPVRIGIRQYFVAVEQEEFKCGTLCDLCESFPISEAIIYCNTRCKAVYVAGEMTKRGFTVLMGSDLGQEERQRSKHVTILTDLFARGADVQQVSLVVNYDPPFPSNEENYLHRISQSGRCGQDCVAITFVTNGDMQTMGDIERFYHTQEELPSDFADWI